MPPAQRRTLAPPSTRTTFAETGLRLIRELLFDPRRFWQLAALLVVGELALGLLIIRFVPYTEIDYRAYSQQVAGFLAGERDYSRLEGDTGPLVYPALHLYIYTLLERLPITPPWLLALVFPAKLHSHLVLQLVFLGLYLVQLGLTATIYRQAGVPQLALVPLTLDKRAHSIYMLRLFGDCWAVALVSIAVLIWQRGWWKTGSVVYSLALGVKMNILLYLPGLLLLYWKAIGPAKMLLNLALIGFVQLLLPAPFFLSSRYTTVAYLTSAFDFSRSFLYKWTVNWRFVPEPMFLAREFHVALLAGQAIVLALFGWRWCRSERGGALGLVRRGIEDPLKGAARRLVGPREVAAILFTSNLVGILFARSLHYQFQSWYFYQLPLLVHLSRSRLAGALLLVPIAYGWATYPSTEASSLGLVLGSAGFLALVWLGDAEGRRPSSPTSDVDGGVVESRKAR